MRYYKVIANGYLLAIGTGSGGEVITEAEYSNILEIIHNRPTAPDGFEYRLTVNMEWELYELPPEESDPELTEAEMLDILLGGAV